MLTREKIFATNRSQGKDVDMAQVLVIEDESEIRDLICLHLLRQGYKVKDVPTADEGLKELQKEKFDLIVLDWMLPGTSGIDFVRLVKTNRGKYETPILMLTAKAEPEDVVLALESGADDYVVKPFDPSVLLARVRALLRRSEVSAKKTSPDEIQIGDLYMNQATYKVSCQEGDLQLTPSEFKLLFFLCQNAGRVITRDKLIEQVQGSGVAVTGRTIDTHVFGLRKKLGTCMDLVETIRGVGYRVKEI